jgi:hypothetical protein
MYLGKNISGIMLKILISLNNLSIYRLKYVKRLHHLIYVKMNGCSNSNSNANYQNSYCRCNTHIHASIANTNPSRFNYQPMGLNPVNIGINRINYQQIDPTQVDSMSIMFLENYYYDVTSIGWSAVQGIYDRDSTIACNGVTYTGGHSFLNYLLLNGVKRANYNIRCADWSLIDGSVVIINVSGDIQFVNFVESLTLPKNFSETFVIKGTLQGTHVVNYQSINFI